jgi:hypothetical protein
LRIGFLGRILPKSHKTATRSSREESSAGQ